MPEMRLIGPFEHLVLEAVAAVETRAYGSRVYEKARELADKEVNVNNSALISNEKWNGFIRNHSSLRHALSRKIRIRDTIFPYRGSTGRGHKKSSE